MWNHFVKARTYMTPACEDFRSAYLSMDMDAGTTDLQASLEKVLKQFKPDEPILSSRPLKQQLQEFVGSHKVLYVLDNVTYAEQLDALLPSRFAAGSIVIVTSRYKDLPLSDALRQVEWAVAGPE
jgi:hypothetical protein